VQGQESLVVFDRTLLSCDFPHDLVDLFVFKSVIDAIRSYQYVIKSVGTVLFVDNFRITDHDSFRSS
jgi:hypothetical protein